MGWKELLRDLDKIDLVELREYTAFELETKLAILMEVTNVYQTCLKTGALIDGFFHLVQFVNEKEFSDDLYECLFKLFITLLENLENGMSLEKNISFFQQNLVMYYEEIENSSEANNEVKSVIGYMLISFFQHYNLYSYLFTCEQEIKEVKHEIFIESVPSIEPYPPPLEQSINEDWYNRFINSIPDEIEEEHEGDEVVNIESDQKTEEMVENSEEETIAQFLISDVGRDEVIRLVQEGAKEKLQSAKIELESKISEKETFLLKSISK